MQLIQSCVHKDLTRRGFQRCISVLSFNLNVKPSASEEKGPFTTWITPPCKNKYNYYVIYWILELGDIISSWKTTRANCTVTLFRVVVHSKNPIPKLFDFTDKRPANRIKDQHSTVFSVSDKKMSVLLVKWQAVRYLENIWNEEGKRLVLLLFHSLHYKISCFRYRRNKEKQRELFGSACSHKYLSQTKQITIVFFIYKRTWIKQVGKE